MHCISGSTFCQLQKCLHTTSSDFCDFTGLIHFLYLILRRQLLRKGARASSCQSHAEGVFIISALPVSGQETGYHRISGSDTIFQGSLRCFRRIDASILRQKNRALACHRNQHVDRTFSCSFFAYGTTSSRSESFTPKMSPSS